MYFLYDVLRCLGNCFKCLQIFYVILHLPYLISVFFEIFKKTNSVLCLKLFIYLFIFHILDQKSDQIMTALKKYFFFFQKISLLFSPQELYSLFCVVLFFFFKGKMVTIFYFNLSFIFQIVVLMSFINFFSYVSWCF